MTEERLAYLALTQVPGMGPARLAALLTAYPSPLGAHSAPFELYAPCPGFRAMATALKETPLATGRKNARGRRATGCDRSAARRARVSHASASHSRPTPGPLCLRNRTLLSRPAAAVVGSRDHSSYGASVCRQVAGEAARTGVVIVSGMARGLDAVAHAAALDAGGTTIGVLGNGHGVIYPAANRKLYERVSAEGLLLSEFAPGERPHAGSFPRRNRLISGLSRVTVVIEAAVGSGALITAGTALDQGREVMAVPGNITSTVSEGTNRLIRDGATPLLQAGDLLQHFPELGTPSAKGNEAPRGQLALPEILSAAERELAGLFGPEPLHPDELARRSGWPIGEVLGTLCGLEIAGVVVQGPGRVFRRSGSPSF